MANMISSIVSIDEAQQQSIYNLNGIAFFSAFEKHINTAIPMAIKKILLLCDYDSLIVIQHFDENCISDMEQFLRNTFDESFLDENENTSLYLGRFSQCQKKFQFTSGQKTWLKIIAKTCKDLSAQRPPENKCCSNIPSPISQIELDKLKKILHSWISVQTTLVEVRYSVC